MSAIRDVQNPWRQQLIDMPASFRGVQFHIETGSRISGRRTVVHEYPKRSNELGPFAEDMGQRAIRWPISAYLIYNDDRVYNYLQRKEELINALDKSGAGMLRHPVLLRGQMMAMCENYTLTETREQGGKTTFDMQFVQAGSPGNIQKIVDTYLQVVNSANAAGESLIDSYDKTSRSTQ